jgi:uncharacterized coiled-coil protein SlyX
MTQQAKVSSVEAIESFRANLIVYLPKARGALEEITSEVLRLRLWLEGEQTNHWDKQLRVRSREMERAQSELFGARLSRLQVPTAAQQMDVTRARRALREAEGKLQMLKRWRRELEHRTAPMVKQLEQLNDFVARDLVRAIAHLTELVKTLDAYRQSAAPAAPPPASEAAGKPGAPEGGRL